MLFRSYPKSSFSEIVREMQDQVAGALKHQDYPFSRIVQEFGRDEGKFAFPLTPVLFNMLPHVESFDVLAKASLGHRAMGGDAKVDINWYIFRRGDDFHFECHYKRALFSSETIERFVHGYENLLAELLNFPYGEIRLISLFTREGAKSATSPGRQPLLSRDKVVSAQFESAAMRSPHSIAVEDDFREVSYATLNAWRCDVASKIAEKGVVRSGKVALLFDRNAGMIAAVLGVLSAGAAYVPLDPQYPVERLRFMLRDSGAHLLLCDPQSLAAARELIESPELFGVCEILSWHPRDADGCSNCETKIPDHDPDELAYLLYTSGSTGKPKGVAQTHRNLIHHVEQYIDVTQLRSSDTLAMSASYSFDASLLDIFGTLLVGGKLLILNLESIERYASLASRGGAITILHATPTTFRYLVDRAVVRTSWPQGTLRLCVLGGEPLTRREISLFNEIAPESAKLMSLMGSTEASIISVKYVDEASISMPVPLGRPVEATSVSLYRNDEEVIDCFVEGELVVYSEHVAKGYLNQDAEKDSMVFGIDPEGRRYYRTGDYGMYLPDGGIRPTGRRDRQFKIHGVRIDLGEIEFQLNSYPDVMDCCCLVRHIEAQDQELVAFTVRTADSVVDLQNLRRYLSRTLPSVMIPNRFIFIKALPKTPSGKIDRQKLLREDPEVDAAAAEQVSFITPTTASEVIVADIWSHILSVSNLSTTDSFFDLGGHSLLAMRTIAKISERMGVEVPLRTLFEFPRLGEFAAHVERSGKESKIVIPRLSRDSPMELSHAQKRIWFSHQYEQNKSAYNVSVSVDICGLFDPALIERAFLLLIERHESLRTIFLVRDGRPVQLVLRSVPFRLEVYDQLQSAPNHLRTEIIARLEREATEVQFDLEQGPLFRAKLILKERARGTLLFTIHHLITDGWSMGLLGSELVRAYSALFEEGSMLEPPQYGYVDYANWCNMALSGDSLKRGLSYWIEKLADAPPLLTLPTDRPRSSIRSGEGGFIHLRVPISPVRNLAARSDCTLFMVLAGAFNALVYRYSGQDDICIGTPVAGRSLSQFDDVIGLFANTVVLRSKVEGGKLFSEFLADFRDTCLDAYSYQEVPFELLVEALRPERSLSYSPIFQVMFSLQNAPREKMNIAGMELDFRRNARSFARHDLLCDIFEEGDELLLSFEYCADIFDRTTVERLAGHYVKLLDEVCLDSNIALDRIGLLSAVEKTELIHARRKLGAMILPPARCVHEVFVEHACATPGATALSFGGGTLTYGELNASVNKLARHLVKIGVEKNDLVGLYIRRTPEMIISLLAILKVGAAYLPLDANYPPERLTYMINDARPAAVVTTSALDTLIGIGCARMVLLDRDEALIDALSPDNFDTDSDGLRLAYVIYTSGSTGNPKGVAISHGALSNVLASIGDVAEIGSNDAWLAITSLSFDISALEIFLPLIRGGRVVLASEADGKDGHRLLELVRKNRVSVMQATPATWSLLKSAVEGDAAKSPALRVALCGGESWGPELLGFLTAWSSRVWNVYGPTETTIWSSANELRAGDAVVLGNPIANTGIYVLDSQMQLVPIGIVGEIYISGAGLSLGYVNQTELTAERFLKAPFSEEIIYKTGDLARYVQGGNIEYLARVDTQTKIRGFRIELGEIETLLSAMPQVARAIVAVREFAPGEKALIAYVVPSKLSDGSIEIEAIERALREKLPEYMIPSAFVAVDNFPLTLNGKIDRQALPAPDAASYLSGEGPLPKTEKEVLLSRAWCSVLGIERVSRGDNFFHLGGHSLLTVRLIVKAKEYGLNLTYRAVFAHPLLMDQAAAAELADLEVNIGVEHRVEGTRFELTDGQRVHYWESEPTNPSLARYNVFAAFQIDGPLSLARIEHAINNVIRRFDSLRSVVRQGKNAKAHQLICGHKWMKLRVDYLDFDFHQAPTALEAYVRREVERPFYLSSGRPSRFRLAFDVSKSAVLVITVHHVFIDGESMKIVCRELADEYRRLGSQIRLSDSNSATQNALPAAFRNFVLAQKSHTLAPPSSELKTFWKSYLGAPWPVYPIESNATSAVALISHEFSFGAAALQKLALRLKVTPFILILTALKRSLSIILKNSDVIVETPFSLRKDVLDLDVVGRLVEVHSIRTKINPYEPELMSLRKVQNSLEAVLRHQNLSPITVKEMLHIERNKSLAIGRFRFVEDVRSEYVLGENLRARKLPRNLPSGSTRPGVNIFNFYLEEEASKLVIAHSESTLARPSAIALGAEIKSQLLRLWTL